VLPGLAGQRSPGRFSGFRKTGGNAGGKPLKTGEKAHLESIWNPYGTHMADSALS
jgi:hypothetical protein